MMRNMAASLIEHERIITTIHKAKTVKPFVEKIVTLAKDPTLHHRRLAFARLRSRSAVEKLFGTLGPRFAERPGGYCRILRLNRPRLGDKAQRVVLEFVERTPETEEAAAE
jgi:large subunit ribosomal protein L17